VKVRKVCCFPGCGRITEPGKSRCRLHPRRKVPRDRAYRTMAAAIANSATRCGICGRPFVATDRRVTDHIIPIARGGTDDPWNLQAAHDRCNGVKSAKLPGGGSTT
jgi:5-methylcytosine-specific restriction endonuclease McrA